MIVIKIRALYENDIKTHYGNIIKIGNNEIVVNIKTKEIDENFIRVWATFSENNQLNIFEVENVKLDNNTLTLKGLKKVDFDSEREYNRIDYKGIFKIKKVEPGEKRKYVILSENNTFASKSSLAQKVKNVIPNESLNNQLVLKFLLEMNNKLDDIITLLKDNEISTDLISVNAVDISGGGLSFFSKEIFNENDTIYLEGEIAESYYKIKLSVLCKIVSIIKTPKGFIYGANYDNIDREIREEIVKFIFEKERELIKGSKNR
ncbi:PilZ domain-containing protein [Deferribacterales bacterium Es71-Z0220]|uniref:PilZ domain-containing protein n=1 Tax=Deferrivibrio essentukiensis TaxID=2880922 RepID=UPI001F614170|nr:PilZ domain-containing protein [Deferrivibrio essentukiensis]MCB4204580.1 PilZ domain-containing protein [Deferrivibrio essentukiensis]